MSKKKIFKNDRFRFCRNGHEPKNVLTGTMKIGFLYDGPPHQALSEARRARSIFKFLVTNPPRGRPFGAAVFIITDR
jgi:hypothetical protein